MSSPGQESSYSQRTSGGSSAAPSLGSSGRQESVGGRPVIPWGASRQGRYVSPYPPLDHTSTTSSTGSVSATAGTRATSVDLQASLSAAAANTSASQEERSLAQKRALIAALSDHRINTLGELRRVERIFATLGSSDLTQPMTAAWMYYVNSNSLLTEIRSLTRNYPFSSECLNEGKRRVHQDPASNRSWNYCWLVLAKIHTDGLIPVYARAQAVRPEMWGGHTPNDDAIERLTEAFTQEWSTALAQLLRYWESAPIVR